MSFFVDDFGDTGGLYQATPKVMNAVLESRWLRRFIVS
jgi:hypothetical protein